MSEERTTEITTTDEPIMVRLRRKPLPDVEGTCEDCVFWRSTGTGHEIPPVGHCRVKSPVVVDGRSLGQFPVTQEDSWCGEFRCCS